MALDKVNTKVIADDAVTGAKIENNPTVAGNLTVAGTSTLTGNATASGNLTVTGNTTVAGDFVPSEPLSNRNMIINGGMQVWQRGTSATAATGSGGSYGTVDRFKFCDHGDGAYTHEKHTMSLAELNTTGHRNAIKLACTTTAPASAGHHAYILTMLEGQDCQRPLYGTANAKDMTLSFWVKSNKTGVYTISLYSLAATNYQIPIEYTINSADTWEKKEILISPTAGSTSLITSSGGLIANGNAQAFTFYFGLHWEASLEGTNNTWVTAGGAYGTSNQVNWLDSTSNNFYLTGVQLEVGDQATDFEHLPFDVQLQRCQRYFYKHTDPLSSDNEPISMGNMYSSSQCNGIIHFPVTMRASPSLICTDASTHFRVYRNNTGETTDNWSAGNITRNAAEIYNNSDVSGTAGHAATITTDDASASLSYNAEL